MEEPISSHADLNLGNDGQMSGDLPAMSMTGGLKKQCPARLSLQALSIVAIGKGQLRPPGEQRTGQQESPLPIAKRLLTCGSAESNAINSAATELAIYSLVQTDCKGFLRFV